MKRFLAFLATGVLFAGLSSSARAQFSFHSILLGSTPTITLAGPGSGSAGTFTFPPFPVTGPAPMILTSTTGQQINGQLTLGLNNAGTNSAAGELTIDDGQSSSGTSGNITWASGAFTFTGGLSANGATNINTTASASNTTSIGNSSASLTMNGSTVNVTGESWSVADGATSTITATHFNGDATTAQSVDHTLSDGTHITGGSFNGSANVTIGTDATNANTASTIVARDGSGNFSAGTITATLNGDATTAQSVDHTLSDGTHITGGSFNGSANVTIGTDATNANTASTIVARDGSGNFSAGTITATLNGDATTAQSVDHTLSDGTHITGGSFNGSAAITIGTDATNANTASTIVARDVSGNFSAGTITAALNGDATTAQSVDHTLSDGTHITGGSFNGSAAITIGTDATNANTASTIVARDGSGNFSAGTITATLTGTASNASALENDTWAAPGAIGSGTASTGAFTQLAAGQAISGSDVFDVTGVTNINTSGSAVTTIGNIGTGGNVIIDAETCAPTPGTITLNAGTISIQDGCIAAGTGVSINNNGHGPTTLGNTVAATTINGQSWSVTDGSSSSTITATHFDGTLSGNATTANSVNNSLSDGTHITGGSFNGSAAITIGTDATNLNTASTIVARDGSGNFSAGTITATLTGTASNASALENDTWASPGTIGSGTANTGAFSQLAAGQAISGSDVFDVTGVTNINTSGSALTTIGNSTGGTTIVGKLMAPDIEDGTGVTINTTSGGLTTIGNTSLGTTIVGKLMAPDIEDGTGVTINTTSGGLTTIGNTSLGTTIVGKLMAPDIEDGTGVTINTTSGGLTTIGNTSLGTTIVGKLMAPDIEDGTGVTINTTSGGLTTIGNTSLGTTIVGKLMAPDIEDGTGVTINTTSGGLTTIGNTSLGTTIVGKLMAPDIEDGTGVTINTTSGGSTSIGTSSGGTTITGTSWSVSDGATSTITATTFDGALTGMATNASELEGTTWDSPGTIGSTAPNTGAFSSLDVGPNGSPALTIDGTGDVSTTGTLGAAATTITLGTGTSVALSLGNGGSGEDISANNWNVTEGGAATFIGGLTVGQNLTGHNISGAITFIDGNADGGSGVLSVPALGGTPVAWTLPAAGGVIATSGNVILSQTTAQTPADFNISDAQSGAVATIANTGSGAAISASDGGTGTGQGIYVSLTNASNHSSAIHTISHSSGANISAANTGSGSVIDATDANAGTGSGLSIELGNPVNASSAISISNGGSGNDITGNQSYWSVSSAGAGTFTSVTTAPTANGATSAIVKQTSGTHTSGDIFDVTNSGNTTTYLGVDHSGAVNLATGASTGSVTVGNASSGGMLVNTGVQYHAISTTAAPYTALASDYYIIAKTGCTGVNYPATPLGPGQVIIISNEAATNFTGGASSFAVPQAMTVSFIYDGTNWNTIN